MLSNIEKVKEHFCGDEELIAELIEVFESSYLEVVSKLELAIEKEDLDQVQLEAHTLKGMVANFFAKEIVENAFEIEVNRSDLSQKELTEKVAFIKNQIPLLIEEIKNAKF